MSNIQNLLRWSSGILPKADTHITRVCNNYSISNKVESRAKFLIYAFQELDKDEIQLVAEACIWTAIIELNEEKRVSYNPPPINYDVLANIFKNTLFRQYVDTDLYTIKKRIKTQIISSNTLLTTEPLVVLSIYVRGKTHSIRIPPEVKKKG